VRRRWQMADGRWQMADGRWQMPDDCKTMKHMCAECPTETDQQERIDAACYCESQHKDAPFSCCRWYLDNA
jgi:hypothetical protein